TNGHPDTSFGGTGQVVTDFAGADDSVQALLIQPDTKIVAVGRAGFANNGANFGLARYNASDGSLDTGFGVGSLVSTSFGVGSFNQAFAAARQSTGNIVAVGQAVAGSAADFGVARYNTADGSLDTSFSGDGLTTTTFFGSNIDRANAVVVQPDG